MIQCVGPVCTIRPTEQGALLLPGSRLRRPSKASRGSREIAPQKAPEVRVETAPAAPESRSGTHRSGHRKACPQAVVARASFRR